MKKIVPKAALAAVLAGVSAFLLKSDVITFWTWWLMAGLLGMLAMENFHLVYWEEVIFFVFFLLWT